MVLDFTFNSTAQELHRLLILCGRLFYCILVAFCSVGKGIYFIYMNQHLMKLNNVAIFVSRLEFKIILWYDFSAAKVFKKKM